jgi:hypothetical protein
MNRLPIARSTEIVVQELGKEVLVYDLNTHKAFNLNETSSIVYRACDGKTTFDELKLRVRFTDEIIFLALDELKKENLLEESQVYNSPFTGMSRREAIRKVGLASMIALPVISSLVAPTAAMAQSAGSCQSSGQTCINNHDFAQSNCCNGLRCDGGRCSNCINSVYQACFSGTEASCLTQCNSVDMKNICCNSGSARVVAFSGGYLCYCP